MIVNENNFAEAARCLDNVKDLAVDTETTGLHPHTRDVVAGISTFDGENSFYFPIRHSATIEQCNITPDQYATLLKIISNVKVFRNHNTKFDLTFLTKDGLNFKGEVVDTQPGAQLLDENGSLKLKLLGDRYLGISSSEEEKKLNATLDKWGFNKGEMWKLPPSVSAPYAEKDTVLAWKLVDYIREKLPPELMTIWEELNNFSEQLRRMETRGILIDMEKMALNKAEARTEAFKLEQLLRTKFKQPINVNSPAQIARIFALPKADEETLLTIKHVEGVNEVLQYRWYMKAINTYYNKYPNFIDSKNVIHSDFNITGTETGRLSSSDPNLTAVPRYSKEQKVKDVFIPRPGYTFIEADYSQAEIRVAAHYTRDPHVIEIFESGLDYHTETAKALGIERQKAKVINLAINYGAGVNALKVQLGWPEKKVKEILMDYHRKFPGFRKTSKEVEKVADERGFVKYWTGRRRHFNATFSESRKAFNSIVQGGTAEMVRRTMAGLEEEVPEAIQLLQVHDSILFEVPKELLRETAVKIKKRMEDQPQFSVQMKVDLKEGDRWSQLKEMHI